MRNARNVTNDFRSDPIREKSDFKKSSSYRDSLIKGCTIKDLKIASSNYFREWQKKGIHIKIH